MAGVVEQSADGRPSSVYVLHHRLDAGAIRAVRDAVVTEVQAEAAPIQQEVSNSEPGGRVLEARWRQADDLRDEASLCEDILSIALSGLHRVVDETGQAAAMASLLLSAEPATSVA